MDEVLSGLGIDRLRPAMADLPEDFLLDIVSPDGTVLWANDEQLEALAQERPAIVGQPLEVIYTPQSAATIREALIGASARDYGITVELGMLSRGGRLIRTLACMRYVRFGLHRVLRIAKMPLGPMAARLSHLEDEERFLRDMIETAAEGFWCIEFVEPVDINQPRGEIIRQIFENQSYWRMMSSAMAELYQIPEEIDFHTQSVRLYWPRSEANERFAGEIIDAGYKLNSALSVDRRHDGTLLYVENDVGARIEDGYLKRLWGTARDVSERFAAQGAHAAFMTSMRAVFDALPDPMLILDHHDAVVGYNDAFEERFAVDQAVASLVAAGVRRSRSRRGSHFLTIPTRKGRRESFSVRSTEVPVANAPGWKLLILSRVQRDSRQGGAAR